MKEYKVYEIINSVGTVEWVGETSRELKHRFNDHTKRKPVPGYGYGKFYGRQDLSIHEVARFNSRKEARLLEGQLKREHGMVWTEKIWHSEGGKIGGKTRRKLTIEQAEEIRKLYSTENIKQIELAKQYEVSQMCISRIIKNLRYIN